MKTVLQLFGSIANTFSSLFGKTSGPVRFLLVLTILLVPGALFFQFFLKWWLDYRKGYRQKAIDAVSWRPGFSGRQESRRDLIQTSTHARNTSEVVYEYALYAVVVLLTALAVIFYMAGSKDQQISSLNIYAGAIYFGVLGAAFHRLNALYRRRKLQRTDVPGMDLEGFTIPTELVRNDSKISAEPERQLARAYTSNVQSVLGLSIAQLAIALVVFIAACLTFTWALTILR